MLISMCGKANSGKDTVADYLVRNYNFKKISLAEPLKRLVKDVFVLSDKTVYDRVEREKELKEWKGWSVRKLLQYIGTELFRDKLDDEIWVKSLWQRIKKDKKSNYVISDCRFPSEINYLKENSPDFISIKVVRDGCDGKVGIIGHASESFDLKTDYMIFNDKGFEELYNKIDDIVKEKMTKKDFQLSFKFKE